MQLIIIIAALLGCVVGQHTEAVCNVTSLSWTFNTLGQSPCLIGAYLATPCSSTGDFDVPALESDHHYTPPLLTNECVCNTVIYSLFSACASCQDAQTSPWTDYSTNCTGKTPDGQYGFAIPPKTAVPAWAYQLVQGSNRFNLTQAQLVGGLPENVSTISTSSSVRSHSSSTSTAKAAGGTTRSGSSDDPSKSGVSDDSGKSGSTNVGAIVGGVVGGVGGIAIIGGIVAFLLLRKRKEKAAEASPTILGPDSHYVSQYTPPLSQYTPTLTDSAKMSVVRTSPPPTWPTQPQSMPQPMYNPNLNAKPYDPDDPSTFPPPA